jgi:hypothetical protein
MRHFSFLFVVFYLISTFCGYSQATSVNSFTYGGLGNELVTKVVMNNDKEYYLLGQTSSNLNAGTNVFVMKLDSNMQCIWEYNYGGVGVQIPGDLLLDSESNVVVWISTLDINSNGYDMQRIKFSSEGVLLSNNYVVKSGWQFVQKVVQVEEQEKLWFKQSSLNGMFDLISGDYIENEVVNDNLLVTNQDSIDIRFVKYSEVDSNFIVLVEQTRNSDFYSYAIFQEANGEGIVTSESSTLTQGLSLKSAIQVESGVWIVGGIYHNSSMSWISPILSISTNGQIELLNISTLVSEYSCFNSMMTLVDGSWVFSGFTKAYGSGQEDIWIHKYDSNFNWVGGGVFGGAGKDISEFMFVPDSTSLVLFGHTQSYPTMHSDFQLWSLIFNDDVITSSSLNWSSSLLGCLNSEVEYHDNLEEMAITRLPGPALQVVGNVSKLVVYNMLGQLIFDVNKPENTIPLLGVIDGLYFIVLENKLGQRAVIKTYLSKY